MNIINSTLATWQENNNDKASLAVNAEKNQLLIHAIPILIIVAKIKDIADAKNIVRLQQNIINSLKTLEINLRQTNYSPKLILAARYCLTTALDEAVMKTAWGENSIWADQSLLSTIHKETWGGERFFIILEKLAADPKYYLDLLEIIFVLLKLGFQGKYSTEHKALVDDIQYRLFHIISTYRNLPTKKLSPRSIDPLIVIKNSKKLLSIKKIAIFPISILLIIAIIFNYQLHDISNPILREINMIGK